MNERTESAACGRVRGRLEQLLEGELPSNDEARDQGHLEACADCGAERDHWVSLLDAMRSEADGLDFALEGLDARLSAARKPRPMLRLLREGWLPAAAVAAAGFGGMMLLRGTEYAEQGLLAARHAPGKELQEALVTRPQWMTGIEKLLGED